MKEPNIVNKAKNLIHAVTNWATEDKFNRVSSETFKYRKEICDSCPFWDQLAYKNLGKCTKCGCSVAKLYIPSSKCPDIPPRWLPINISASYSGSNAP